MESKKKYYKYLDFIRIISCFAVLLYHLNILKGGYLAVCCFFVLSSYLSCVSSFKKEKFSFKSYYSKLLLKIYLPLILIVFITIAVLSLFPNINWLNLKPETTSVIFGYNNFWQLGANLDYFARHISSPFMHLWYISILLQYDLIFPFIYLTLRKIGDKIHKFIPCLITVLLCVIFSIYFYISYFNKGMMFTYYNTFTRLFSLLFGLSLGFIHSYYGSYIPSLLKRQSVSKIMFWFYALILISMFIFIGYDSKYFPLYMVLSTIFTCRLIDYGVIIIKRNISKLDKLIRSLSLTSYEIYLFQYPVIYLFQYVNINSNLETFIIIMLVLLLSYILYLSINFYKGKFKLIKYFIFIVVVFISLFGLYKYCLSKDYTKEMKKLEEQLEENEKIIQNKQEEYEAKLQQEQNDWEMVLSDLENNEEKVNQIIKKMPVIGIGDSVMLGAIENLYNEFPNGYFDAKISRTAWVVSGMLQDYKNRNMLSEIVILHLGTNGDCSSSCKTAIMKICENHEVFWVNTTNDDVVHVNDKLLSLANEYSNLHIVDWNSISKGHEEYFYADGIHLTPSGRKAYTNAIYDNIYKVYLKKYKIEKEKIIKEHEEKQKNKISFYGNDILINSFDYLQNSFKDAKFDIKKDFNYDTLKEEIEKSIKDGTLNNKIVFAFDDSTYLDLNQYKHLIELCKEHKIYIVCLNEKIFNDLNKENYENVTLVDFYKEIKLNEYLMPDKIHLNEKGNEAFNNVLKDALNNINH